MKKENTMMSRGERTLQFRRTLESALQARRWTQARLAQRLGVSQPTIGNWLRGRYVPTPDEVFAMERVLAMVPGELAIHLGYVPAACDSLLGRLVAHLLGSADGREILADVARPAGDRASGHAA